MTSKIAILLILLTFPVLSTTAQNKTNLGVINGRATFLPIPEVSNEAKAACASGRVELDVLVGVDGKVVEVKAISGDELLRGSSEEAVRKATFLPNHMPTQTRGFVVYNFPRECANVGVLNKKASKLPLPKFPRSCRCQGTIFVEVVIDSKSGQVTNARAFSGNPLLRVAAVNAAKLAMFGEKAFESSGKDRVKGLLVYKFSANWKSSTDYKPVVISCGVCNSNATHLPKPEFPETAKYLRLSGAVIVQIVINEMGDVVTAKAVSGHPLLRPASIKAAFAAQFEPIRLSGNPVQASGVIIYNFLR